MDRHQLKRSYHNKLQSSQHVSPFRPFRDSVLIDSSKRGLFHQSAVALSLYCTSTSKRSMFPKDEAPYGYLFSRGADLMALGIFRRYDGRDYGCILPLRATHDSIGEVSRWMIRSLDLAGVYVRFLDYEGWGALLSRHGFIPPRLHPWNPDAPQEDETHNFSKIPLEGFLRPSGTIDSKNVRRLFSRAERFLQRNGSRYRIVPLQEGREAAWSIISQHFDYLGRSGKLVGSSADDYLGMLSAEVMGLRSVRAYLGLLENPDLRTRTPVSLFICDDVGCDTTAVYAGITLRNPDRFSLILSDLSAPLESWPWREASSGTMPAYPCSADVQGSGLPRGEGLFSPSESPSADFEDVPESKDFDRKGFSAFSLYALSRLLILLKNEPDPPRVVDLGGSETHQLNKWKRDMGAELSPTFWALLRQCDI